MPTVSDVPTRGSALVAGLDLHLEEAGDGRPVVVVHRSTGPWWGPSHDLLARRWRVVQPHLAGYGRSERPDRARAPRDLAILLGRQLDALGLDRPALVGLGLGGWVAADLAAMAPDRVGALVLVGAPGLKPRHGFIHDPMMAGWIDYVRLGFADQAAFDAAFGPEPDPEVVDRWDRSREMTARLTWRPWMWSVSLPVALRDLPTPTLVVWGGEDLVVPLDCAHQYVELLGRARLEVVPGVGHNVDLEAPDRLAGLIDDFLTDTCLTDTRRC